MNQILAQCAVTAPSCPRDGEVPNLPEAHGYLVPEVREPGAGGIRHLERELPGFLRSAALGFLESNVSPSLRIHHFIVWLEALPGVMVRRQGENLNQCTC